jgi:hypothetical protein
MVRKDVRKALGESLKAEEQAVRQRFGKKDKFARAEAVMGEQESTISPRENGHERVIRDSFTMPITDYGLITEIKSRCLKKGTEANKSEIVRAGLAALNAMSDVELLKVLQGLTRVKTGRPATKK